MNFSCSCSRRRALAIAGGALGAAFLHVSGASTLPSPMPMPIAEIDVHGHHNVPPGPYTEPSEILNFHGTVGTAVLVGTARDNHGRRLQLGGLGTDVRFMQGEYQTADGVRHKGTFTHL